MSVYRAAALKEADYSLTPEEMRELFSFGARFRSIEEREEGSSISILRSSLIKGERPIRVRLDLGSLVGKLILEKEKDSYLEFYKERKVKTKEDRIDFDRCDIGMIRNWLQRKKDGNFEETPQRGRKLPVHEPSGKELKEQIARRSVEETPRRGRKLPVLEPSGQELMRQVRKGAPIQPLKQD